MQGVHEFSIAEALAAQVQRHAPPSGRVREVEIIKMRGSHHEHELREAHITSKGFIIGTINGKAKKKEMKDVPGELD